MTRGWGIIAKAMTIATASSFALVAQEEPHGKAMEAILQELRVIRRMLEDKSVEPPPAHKVRVRVYDAPYLGMKDAPFTIVNFTDFECPHCSNFHLNTLPDIKRFLIDSGKVRYYSMELPIIAKHPHAMTAALAGRCAAAQGKFWLMHDKMQSNPEKLTRAELLNYSRELGLDEKRMDECLNSGRHRDDIDQSMREAAAAGANGTPAFVVGNTTPEGVEGELILGAVPMGRFEQVLRRLSEQAASDQRK